MRLVLGLILILCLGNAATAQSRLFMLDFVFLNKDVPLQARDAYNEKAKPIAARHGASHVRSLDPLYLLQGPDQLVRLDLWALANPEVLRAWGADPDFKTIQPESLAVHDMRRLTLYFAQEMAETRLIPGGVYWIEFLQFSRAGFNGSEFSAYMQRLDQVAGVHGLNRVATFGKVGRVMGPGFEAHWMNIYNAPDPDRLKAHFADPAFLALTPQRETLFDLENSILGVFQAK